MADTVDPWGDFVAPQPPRPPEPPQMPSEADPWSEFVQASPPADKLVAEKTLGNGDIGRVFERADGTRYFTSPGLSTSNPEQIDAILGGDTPGEAFFHSDPSLIDVESPNWWQNAILQAGQGAMFGHGDEIGSALMTPFSDRSYDANLAVNRAIMEQGQEDRPWQSLVANVGGGLLSGGALVKGLGAAANASGVAQVASRLPGWVRAPLGGAIAGAADGGLYGFGAGEGGLAKRLENAGDSAAFGAAVGGLLPAVMAVGRPMMRGARNIVTAPFQREARPLNVARSVEKSMSRAGTDADAIEAWLQQAAQEGQGMATITEAIGDPARRALNGVVRQPGSAGDFATTALRERQGGQADRVRGYVQDTLGATETLAQHVDDLRTQRSDNFNNAMTGLQNSAVPVDTTAARKYLSDGIGPVAPVETATGPIDDALSGYLARLGHDAPEADFGRVYRVRRDMKDASEAAYSAGRGEMGDVLKGGRLKLDEALEAASPGYKAANDAYRASSERIRAAKTGAAMASGGRRTADVADAYGALSPDARASFRTGYADPLIARIDNGRFSTNKAEPFMRPKGESDIAVMASNPDLFGRQIGRETDMWQTFNRVTGGSQTADNLADMSDAAMQAAGLVGEAVINPLWAARKAASGLVRGTANLATGNNEATREAIARAYLSNDIRGVLKPLEESRALARTQDLWATLAGRMAANRMYTDREGAQ